jgi:hypothetical protein
MAIAIETTGKAQGGQAVRRSRRSTRRAGGKQEVITEAMLNAPIVTVFRTPDGKVHHGRCHEILEYHGRRAALELDFYCLRCTEHVTLPELVFPRIPVRMPLAQA